VGGRRGCRGDGPGWRCPRDCKGRVSWWNGEVSVDCCGSSVGEWAACWGLASDGVSCMGRIGASPWVTGLVSSWGDLVGAFHLSGSVLGGGGPSIVRVAEDECELGVSPTYGARVFQHGLCSRVSVLHRPMRTRASRDTSPRSATQSRLKQTQHSMSTPGADAHAFVAEQRAT
jgi:hypothetical protein